MSLKYRKALFIVTYMKEKNKILYLLLKRKLHWKGWEFPKGGIKDKERIKKAIHRELKEETGQNPLSIKKFNYRGKYRYDKIYKDRAGIAGQTFSLYSAEIKNKKIRLDRKEHLKYLWTNYNQALKLLTWKNQKKSLKIVDKKLK